MTNSSELTFHYHVFSCTFQCGLLLTNIFLPDCVSSACVHSVSMLWLLPQWQRYLYHANFDVLLSHPQPEKMTNFSNSIFKVAIRETMNKREQCLFTAKEAKKEPDCRNNWQHDSDSSPAQRDWRDRCFILQNAAQFSRVQIAHCD